MLTLLLVRATPLPFRQRRLAQGESDGPQLERRKPPDRRLCGRKVAFRPLMDRCGCRVISTEWRLADASDRINRAGKSPVVNSATLQRADHALAPPLWRLRCPQEVSEVEGKAYQGSRSLERLKGSYCVLAPSPSKEIDHMSQNLTLRHQSSRLRLPSISVH
jgi:hypothetical protein